MRKQAILFWALCVGFLAYAGASSSMLPDPVASHFNAGGHPDGWMSRAGYTLFISAMGLALPLFIVGLTYVTRFLPDWMINLPHKEHWLSPEQRPYTNAYVFNHSFWMGCLMIGLMGGLHYLTIQANRSAPVQLPASAFMMLMAGFLLGLGIWVIALLRRFRNV